jgi:hypothetical protein
MRLCIPTSLERSLSDTKIKGGKTNKLKPDYFVNSALKFKIIVLGDISLTVNEAFPSNASIYTDDEKKFAS